MLKRWQVGHFKSIVKTCDLDLADVTVLTGLNNSGKSSLLQSILLISQTLSSHTTERTLLPDGPLMHFSSLNDIVSDGSDHTLTFGFELSLAREETATSPTTTRSSQKLHTTTSSEYSAKVTVDFHLDRIHNGLGLFSFDRTRKASHRHKEEYVDVRKPSQIGSPAIESVRITLPASDAVNEEIVFAVRKLSEQERSSTPNLSRAQYYSMPYVNGSFSHEGTLSINGQKAAYTYQMLFWHFLPARLTAGIDLDRNPYRQHPDPASSSAKQIEDAVKQITDFLSNHVHYLGPKRVNPSTAQIPVHGTNLMAGDVGPQGELAAAMYYMHMQRATSISWYNPFSKDVERGTLSVAINYWLQYLEVAYSIKCGKTDQNSLNWQVVYQKGQQPHTFAGDSLAVNQVLALLVMGLLAPEGSLLLIEHPELFLHQRAQARLGDFFVGLAACHKRCLIETHSENLVTQLRYHIVREGEHNPNKYMIYFADRNDEGATRFIPIKISPRGNILNWPEGFFDETNLQEEKISIAYLRRKAELAMKQEQLR